MYSNISRSTSPALSISSWCFSSSPPSPSTSTSSSLPDSPPPPISPELKRTQSIDSEVEEELSVEPQEQERDWEREENLLLDEEYNPAPEQEQEYEQEQEQDEGPDMDYEDALIDIRDNSPSPSLSTVGVQEASRVPTPVPPPPTPPPRHPFYYIDDDMAIICVEEQLFKVHKYFLIRESELFQGMFGLPPGDSMTAEGRDDHHPIVLKQVLAREFESLLRFLYHGMFDDCGVTLPQWIDILSISTFWACDKLRARAIKEIHDHRPRIDPVEKVVLAVKYFVPEWLAPSYAAVCQRALPINSVEGHKLGLEKTILLARAREAVRQDHVAREQRHAQGAGGRGNVRQNLNSRTTASPAPPEPEPLPSTASCWGEWKGLTVPPPEDPFDAERVAEIVHEVFQAPEEAGAN